MRLYYLCNQLKNVCKKKLNEKIMKKNIIIAVLVSLCSLSLMEYTLVSASPLNATSVTPVSNYAGQQTRYEIKRLKSELKYFKKVMRSRKYTTREKYLRFIGNENLLYRIAVEHNDIRTAAGAVNKIKSEKLLYQIAMIESTYRNEAAVSAIKRIRSEELLCKLALNYKSQPLRVEAAKRIKDEDLLYQIAEKWSSSPQNKNDYSNIIAKIKRQKLLSQLVKRNEKTNRSIALETVERISEPEMLKYLADSLTVEEVRNGVIHKIDDQLLLYDIAITGNTVAFGKLNEEMLKKIVTDITVSDGIKVDAIRKINDQQFLYEVYNNQKSGERVRTLAFEQLTNQDFLLKIAQEHKDWDVRKKAFNKLDDATLKRVATGVSKDKALAVAAKIILNQTTWDKEFSNQSSQYLGNVIGAAALVDSPKPTSASVVSACHTYIRRGDKSRIPELRDLLLRYGDKALAEDYLNCGNAELYDAGRAWGSRNGYNIGSGYGSNRVSWGSGR